MYAVYEVDLRQYIITALFRQRCYYRTFWHFHCKCHSKQNTIKP